MLKRLFRREDFCNMSNNTISTGDIWRAFTRIGLLSFGGPTAQIAVMHKILVEEKKWIDDHLFAHALSFCMLLPGPEAMQLATYAGWRLLGVRGGLIAGLLFVLPGALVMLLLSIIYALFGQIAFVDALFFGIKAAVLVIVVEALLRVSKRALHAGWHWWMAAFSFMGIFVFDLPFPLIILVAAVAGFLSDHNPVQDKQKPTIRVVSSKQTLMSAALWGCVWIGPLLLLFWVLGRDHILVKLGFFFMKLALVTFGGAYAVLAYMAQDVVGLHGWLEAGQMMTGLGLAETTPGPLILVTEFVGFLSAFRQGGLAAGVMGAFVALWMTFAPCFLWIFAGGPYLEWIIARPRLKAALAAITAAVVGVIFNLTIWFALHVFFYRIETIEVYGARLLIPDVLSIDWGVMVIATLSAYLLLLRHWPMGWVLVAASLLGLTLRFVPAVL
jgi:chromate transporter